MKDLFDKYLMETTWTGMGDEAGNSYPDDGSGIAGDDDRPPGNILIGSRYERRGYFNKLNRYDSIWDVDNKENYKWDYFENATGQDDFDNYSNTLQSMEKLFPEDTWDNTWKKMKNVPDKETEKRFDVGGQPWRSKEDQIGDKEEEVVDAPKELDVKESLDLTDRIDKILVGGAGIGNDIPAQQTTGSDKSGGEKRRYVFHRNTDGRKRRKTRKKIAESKVSDTILKQIKAIDKWALDSYGAKNFVASNDSIQFDVRGSKFRGRVVITYDRGSDTYVVELGQVRGLDWKQKYMMKNIFAQDLVNVLDQHVG